MNYKGNRPELRKRNGQRQTFHAKVERFGTKPGWNQPEPTILLTDVRDTDGAQVADHIWFAKGVSWDGLSVGDMVSFDARVGEYWKGYQGAKAERLGEDWCERDYRLTRPTKVCLN